MIIRASNNLTDNAPYTFLTVAGTAGGTAHYVQNVNQFYTSWGIQFGNTGEEQSEVLVLAGSTPVGTALNTTGTLKYPHSVDTPVYAIKFDQIIFKRSTSGTAGTATAISGGTVTITPDSNETIYDDTSGAVSYAYKGAWYNSVTGDTSGDSDWLTPAGYSFYSLAKLRDRMRNKLYSAGYLQTGEEQISDWANEWLETMNNVAVDVNKDYNLGTADVAFGTSGLGTITSTDFKEVRRLWITSNGSNFYPTTQEGLWETTPTDSFSENSARFVYRGDNVFQVNNGGVAGTARLDYYRLGTVLVNDTDELPVVLRPYTKSFVDYALAQAYYIDGKDSKGDRFMLQAQNELDKFRTFIAPRHKTGIETIHISEPIGGDDGNEFYF